MTGNKVNKCYTSFSGKELWSAITNRLTPIQRAAHVLNSSHVLGFLYQANQEWIKRLNLQQIDMNAGRGLLNQIATQPTASQVLRDWSVPNRDYHRYV
jgi:hypothetical protein